MKVARTVRRGAYGTQGVRGAYPILAVVVVAGRVQLVRPMDPAPIDDHHNLFPGFAEGRHDLMDILTQLLGIKMGHDLIENFGGPILDRADDTE
jgi:hypothetical protein